MLTKYFKTALKIEYVLFSSKRLHRLVMLSIDSVENNQVLDFRGKCLPGVKTPPLKKKIKLKIRIIDSIKLYILHLYV
jgi:hypothetical protein